MNGTKRMSRVTRAHWEIGHAMRWHARKVSPDLKVSGRVERYHRTDGYREVRATSRDPAHVEALAALLRADPAIGGRGMEVHVEVGMLCREPPLHALDVMIGPGLRRAA